MLYLYLVPLQPRVGAPLNAPAPEAGLGGGSKKPRRGGLLHELRYYARLAEEARQAEAALVRQSRARPTRAASGAAAVAEQPLGQLAREDDEVVLLYLAAYW